jgi:hypothetical protein
MLIASSNAAIYGSCLSIQHHINISISVQEYAENYDQIQLTLITHYSLAVRKKVHHLVFRDRSLEKGGFV